MHTNSGTTATALMALALIATALSGQKTTVPVPTSISDAAAPVAANDSTPVSANSKVRIVRLSEVKGAVELDRNTGAGFEGAMANIPIIERARLQTDAGVAEVEFEDNSTLRVAADSLVEFPQLELLPSGAKASTVIVQKGMVYVSLANTKGNEFTLIFGQQKVRLQPSSHIRLQLEPTAATLAVLDGAASVEGPAGTTVIGRKKAFTFDLANQNPPVTAKYVASEPFDSWDHNGADYHKSFSNQGQSLSAFGNSSYSYGIGDMLYYGRFVNAPGCGSLWQPYFVSAGWDPFANGTWAWYPGAGYSWVSPYPWGWTPFHSGSWTSCPGAGWGWQPGSSWNGLNNAAFITMNRQLPNLPQPPGRPPLPGKSTLVPVNLKPLTTSDFGSSRETFVFRKDSAGLGIPRGSFGKLNQLSDQVVHHGTLNAPVYLGPPSTAQSEERSVSAGAFSASRPSYEEPSTLGRPISTISSGSTMGAHSATEPVSVPTTGTATGKPR